LPCVCVLLCCMFCRRVLCAVRCALCAVCLHNTFFLSFFLVMPFSVHANDPEVAETGNGAGDGGGAAGDGGDGGADQDTKDLTKV
jgi:hypothetical protein